MPGKLLAIFCASVSAQKMPNVFLYDAKLLAVHAGLFALGAMRAWPGEKHGALRLGLCMDAKPLA